MAVHSKAHAIQSTLGDRSAGELLIRQIAIVRSNFAGGNATFLWRLVRTNRSLRIKFTFGQGFFCCCWGG